jgi:hypothetical protein
MKPRLARTMRKRTVLLTTDVVVGWERPAERRAL